MKKIHKLALLPLLVCSVCAQAKSLDLAAPASGSANSDLFSRPRYHLPQRQKPSQEQVERLQSQAEFAKNVYNPTIELSALQKLALIKGSSSREYLIEFIRYKVKLGGKNRDEAKEALDKLCALDSTGYECIQGTALYELSSPQMKLKLQTFSMHEDHRNYKEGVEYLNNLMGIPVEHELRYRYYMMLGNVFGSENEAIRGLEGIIREIPRDSQLKMAAKQAVIRFRANAIASRALKTIDNESTVLKSQDALVKALSIDPNNPDAAYWQEILTYSRYYRFIDAGDRKLAKNNPKDSIKEYEKAIKVGLKSPYAYVGLARAYAQLNDEKMFELYSAKAVAYSKTESASEQRRIAMSVRALRAEMVAARALELENAGMLDEAAAVYKQALKLDNSNPWLAYRLSSVYAAKKQPEEALGAYKLLSSSARKGPAYAHAYALSLAREGRIESAYSTLKPYAKTRDASILNTLGRLKDEMQIQKAQDLIEKKRHKEAAAILQRVNSAYAKFLLGREYEALGDRAKAVYCYRQSLSMDNDQIYVKIRMAELYFEDGKKDEANEIASELYANKENLTLSNQRALGQLLIDLGNEEQALEVYTGALAQALKNRQAQLEKLKMMPKTDDNQLVLDPQSNKETQGESDSAFTQSSSAVSEDNYTQAWILRNINEILKKRGGYDAQIDENNRKAMALLDGKNDNYQNDAEFTRAIRTKDEPESDWLRQNIASRSHDEYNRQNLIIHGGISLLKDSGHGGYSDTKSVIYILKATFPLLDGSATIQTDSTSLSAGSLGGGEYDDIFGTCYTTGCADRDERKRKGTSIALGFDNDHLHADIGTAPKISNNQIKHSDIAGGFSYDIHAGRWTFTPALYRRVLNNSLLSYFGDTDPRSGSKWGAVKKNGAALSMSYYIDENQGIWANNAFEYLNGTNVKSNTKISAQAGYYYHIINQPNERLTLSPALMYMHYQNNLSEYTYGQGGYYSPQQYLSTSLALRYTRRYNHTSYMVEPVISFSYSNKKAQSRYPAGDPLSPLSTIYDIGDSTSSDSSFGVGGGIRFAIEQRVFSNLVIGAEASYMKSDDYHPAAAMFYFRYYFRDWQGDLLMPPQGPTPYAQW